VEVISLTLNEPKSTKESGIWVHRVKETEVGGGLKKGGIILSYSKYVLSCSTAMWNKFIELHKQRPFDVVDAPELLAEGLWTAVSKTAPLAVRLYTPHSKFIAERLHNVRPSLDHQLVAALERVAMLSADVLTSPSDDLADFVSVDLNYPRERIKIIRNPIDSDVFTPVGPQAIPSDGRKTVMFVGRLEERKGIHYLIDAIPAIIGAYRNVRFIIIGDDTRTAEGQTSVLDELKERVKENGSGSYIEWIDRVTLDSLPSYYRSADICVVPSVYDNSPYTCLEAMSCGRAVVGTSAGGTREYIVQDESGLIVPPRDAGALAAAILSLLNDDNRRIQIANAARARVLSHFQRREIARQTVDLYEDAIANHAKRVDYKLYRHDPSRLYEDADEFIKAWDQSIFDLLYLDPAYRMMHYLNLFHKRPKLFMAKAIRSVVLKVFGKKAKKWAFMQRLDASIAVKQRAAGMPGYYESHTEQQKELAGSVK
jgi:glycosyltransferase involved in cell wall biosynthesis